MRKVAVFLNPRSGLGTSLSSILTAFQKYWDDEETDVAYRFSKSAEDGRQKIRRVVADGVDTVVVVGGDGMINTLGAELVGTPVKLAVIPTGSGNGFARHFNIPLQVEEACRVLAKGRVQGIDVGTANGRPFFVTCSMAWDASLVGTYEKSPMRGILPYVLAAAYELFEYQPQPIDVFLDDKESLAFEAPMVFTVANLTQFGGGARIAPKALPDDGFLELVVVGRNDSAKVVPQMIKLFDGTLDEVKEIVHRRFQRLLARRENAVPIQMDGEVVEAPEEVVIEVIPKGLQVIVPDQ